MLPARPIFMKWLFSQAKLCNMHPRDVGKRCGVVLRAEFQNWLTIGLYYPDTAVVSDDGLIPCPRA